jgi:anti-sigma B factor antagonist
VRKSGLVSSTEFGAGGKRSVLMRLTLATRLKDGVLVVDCSGRIVYGKEASLLRDTVKEALATNNRIVLNLGDVDYIDSTGLGTLAGLYTSVHNANGAIKLMGLTKYVSNLLEITKLLTIFDVYNSEAEAVESFRRAA